VLIRLGEISEVEGVRRSKRLGSREGARLRGCRVGCAKTISRKFEIF
jgi:hypothetical protein